MLKNIFIINGKWQNYHILQQSGDFVINSSHPYFTNIPIFYQHTQDSI